MSNRTVRLFFLPAALCAVALALVMGVGGCATSQIESISPVGPNAPRGRTPAEERIISGVAELILTDRPWPSFEAALPNRIDTVVDGGSLYAHIRTTRPLGELAHPGDPNAQAAFARHPHLFLQVGDIDSMRILNTCYVTMTPEEGRQLEIVVPLAPMVRRPGEIPTDCWLATVASQRPGRLQQEVRLAGFAGKFERWLPVPDILAVAPIDADLTSGSANYSAMLRAPIQQQQQRPAPAARPAGSSLGVAGGESAPAPTSGSATGQPRPAALPPPSSSSSPPSSSSSSSSASTSTATSSPSSAPIRAASPSAQSPQTSSAAAGSSPAPAAAGAPPPSGAILSAPSAAPPPPVPVPTPVPVPAPSGATVARPAVNPPVAAVVTPVTPNRMAPTTTTEPAPGRSVALSGERLEAQLQALATALLGRRPAETYFTDERWSTAIDQRGQVFAEQAFAAAVFRGASSCSWARLRVLRRPGGANIADIERAGEPREVSCASLR